MESAITGGGIYIKDDIFKLLYSKTVLLGIYNSEFKLVLDKTLESPLDCKKIKPVNPKLGNQP